VSFMPATSVPVWPTSTVSFPGSIHSLDQQWRLLKQH